MHLIKASNLQEDNINKIFDYTDQFAYNKATVSINSQEVYTNSLAKGKILASLFFEPSTRTRLSFETSMFKLGGNVITVEDGVNSSFKKGESIKDTLMTVSEYADIIVLRQQESLSNNVLENVKVPVINAGDGDGEHPTQALLDYYTIIKHFPHEKEINILFLGDLRHSRTAHSLIKLLSNNYHYKTKIYDRSPKNRKLPIQLRNLSEDAEDNWENRILPKVDVVYSIREQKERAYMKVDNYSVQYGLKNKSPSLLKKNAIVMAPLPRGEELPEEYDKYKGSVYFEQVRNGVYVRMGILKFLLENNICQNQ